MSKSIKLFNGLNGVVTRAELEQLADLAAREEQTHIFSKIQDVLFYNVDNSFDIKLKSQAYEIVPKSMLNGLHFEDTEGEFTGLNKAVSPSDIYQMIADRMLNMIKDASGKDYKKKWKRTEDQYLIPFNFDTKRRYRGVNSLLLTEFGSLSNPYFLTFKQIEKHNGILKKGSKGYPVIYFTKLYKVEDVEKGIDFASYDRKKVYDFAKESGIDSAKVYSLPILKYYNVFNGQDVENIDFDLKNFTIGYLAAEIKIESKPIERIAIADAIINNYPSPVPKYIESGNDAFFDPNRDTVQMPPVEAFDTVQDFYRTKLHEYSHSTGVFKRLNRNFSGKFGSKPYAFEELVAEWGATFLSAEAGIIWHTNKNHAEYLKNWNNAITYIKEDAKFVMRACTKAQELTDFILQFDENGMPKYLNDLKNIDPKIEIEKPKKINGQELTKEKPIKPLKSTKKRVSNVQKKTKKEKITNQYGLFGVDVSTDIFKKMSVTELRKFTLDYYKNYLSGKKVVIEQQLKEVVFTNTAGRKIAHGEAMYSDKASVIEHLEELIKKSTYNNFGAAKKTDNPEVLGYLNFKSKLTIDGIKRHLRIALAVYKNRKTELKNIEVGKKESDSPKKKRTSRISQNDMSKPLVDDKVTKKKDTDKKQGLSKPKLAGIPVVEEKKAERLPKIVNAHIKPISETGKNESQFFTVNGEVGEFLQQVERKPFESVVITMDGMQGAGKTTTLYKFIDAFASAGNECLFISGEEHPESSLATQKRDDYLSSEALQHTSIVGKVKDLQQLYEFIEPFDIIFVDSWQKLQRMVGAIRLDEDLRKKFNAKVFVVIFQQTTTGRTKGGAEVVFDGDIIIKMVKEAIFSDNYAYFDKNRYTKVPIETIRYNIASGQCYNPLQKEIPEEESFQPVEFSFQIQ